MAARVSGFDSKICEKSVWEASHDQGCQIFLGPMYPFGGKHTK
jgi:hypothetical protein